MASGSASFIRVTIPGRYFTRLPLLSVASVSLAPRARKRSTLTPSNVCLIGRPTTRLTWRCTSNVTIFLRPYEIDSLARHINAACRGKQGDTISEGKGNTYVGYVAKYLNWLANEVITDANRPEVQDLINTQHRRLIDKLTKDGSKSANAQKLIKKHLSEKAREQLDALWSNPFVSVFRPADRGSRLRTVVMLRVLYETGMRRGELLALKLKHLLESTGGEGPQLVIERNHGDSFDTRVNQPVAKTQGRIVPISPLLERQLMEYIAEYRADVPGVGFDDEDFIFVTHRSKRGQGKPVSESNFGQAVVGLRDLFPALDTMLTLTEN